MAAPSLIFETLSSLNSSIPSVTFDLFRFVWSCANTHRSKIATVLLGRTSFPVLLQPVRRRHGGRENKCIRFALVAAPHVKNVTYIKVGVDFVAISSFVKTACGGQICQNATVLEHCATL